MDNRSLSKVIGFVVAAIAMLIATGPLVGMLGALAGVSNIPEWVYASVFSAQLLIGSSLALRLDGESLENLGLVPASARIREFTFGVVVSVVLFCLLALVRGAAIGAAWTFGGPPAALAACAGLGAALLLMLPEELLFRGYAFQRLMRVIGVWPGILVSATLFGIYHLFGSGMWGIGAFFQLAMPTLGGIAFGWAAVRTNGLALPIGLHLGGNWVQASIFSFRPVGATEPGALWTVYVTDVQQHRLYAPDFSAHAPYIVAMFVLLFVVQLAFPPRASAVRQPY